MKLENAAISACRYCQFYQSQGRRGGYCQQLAVPVQGKWKACSIAIAPFTSGWENLVGLASWRSLSPASEPTLAAPILTTEAKLPLIKLPAASENVAGGCEEILLNIE